jgi:hypothetical protein
MMNLIRPPSLRQPCPNHHPPKQKPKLSSDNIVTTMIILRKWLKNIMSMQRGISGKVDAGGNWAGDISSWQLAGTTLEASIGHTPIPVPKLAIRKSDLSNGIEEWIINAKPSVNMKC